MNSAPHPRYGGLATRGVGFVIDAGILTLIGFVIIGAVSLALSIFGKSISDLPSPLSLIFGVVGAVLLDTLYFVGSWSLTGKTAGQHVMRIRVERDGIGGRISVRRGIIRLVGGVLAAIPLFAGYLPILVDDRRRGFLDWLAGTVVVFDDEEKVVWGGPLRHGLTLEREQLQSPGRT